MPEASNDRRVVGRYALCDRIAGGGMATVHLGRLLGQAGFSRTVAIKRLHAHLAEDPEFVSMFIDEARLAARIHHPNVVSTLDVVARDSELFLVMEYVHGESLARLMRGVAERKERVPPRIAAAIVAGFLHGLHAAHEARNEHGEPLNLVHRDVSPQNVLVGIDGVPRVVDFGVAKAVGRVQTTRDGQLKGKLAYMAPEQIAGGAVTRRTDIYATAIVFWELLAGRRLFQGDNEAAVMRAVMSDTPPAPSTVVPVAAAIDRIVLRGLARDPSARFQTAREMALGIEQAIDVALPSVIGAWVQSIAEHALSIRATLVGNIESSARIDAPASAELLVAPTASVPRAAGSGSASLPAEPPTMLTASSESEHSASASRRPMVLGLMAIAVAAACVLFAFVRVSGSHAAHAINSAQPHGSPSAANAPAKAPAEEPEVATALPPEPAAAASASAPAPVARPELPPAVHPAVAASHVVPKEHVQASAPPPAKRGGTNDCDPPYRIDANGRRIFKVECL